jgi:hypothetical protein
MKLNVAVNEVTLSNVGATGEFRIRNSAKAFKILSDGLYSNKIRAIIRELSCNAVDSHIGAGKQDIPFEVHIPTVLEPWFSVRDFGLGLDGNQVMNIYTTYFESTKTDSNDYIGALGLGSKSPFSYTENFTVTAIKDGIKRIYSAYINEQGVPSVTEMGEEITDEGNGVEVKFSVTERYDYNSFRNESCEVFKWFKHKPKITGIHLDIPDIVFKEKDIIPGVHIMNDGRGGGSSIAVMGNIPYPLNNIPEAQKHLGSLVNLLQCGLVLEFDIGELDFAASREQLSYIPLTINSIKNKLETLNANLTVHLAEKANAIQHDWDRALYLYEMVSTRLYGGVVSKYVADSKFKLFNVGNYHGNYKFNLPLEDLGKKGLDIRNFQVSHGNCYTRTSDREYINQAYVTMWQIPVSKETLIVLNDLKTGCVTRARYHYSSKGENLNVFCISHQDPDLSVREKAYKALLKEMHNPLRVVKASTLEKQVRSTPIKTQGIMTLELREGRRPGYEDSYSWAVFNGKIEDTETYYYVCLNNCESIAAEPDAAGKNVPINVRELKGLIDECGIEELSKIKIFGVRKNRYNEIKELENWIWFEDKLKEEVAKITDHNVASLVVADMIDRYNNKAYTNKVVANHVGQYSPYRKFVTEVMAIKRAKGNVAQLVKLCSKYGKSMQVDTVKKKISDAKDIIMKRYPLLKNLVDPNDTDVAHYINLIDKQEKVNE